jgi:hypothetical protein
MITLLEIYSIIRFLSKTTSSSRNLEKSSKFFFILKKPHHMNLSVILNIFFTQTVKTKYPCKHYQSLHFNVYLRRNKRSDLVEISSILAFKYKINFIFESDPYCPVFTISYLLSKAEANETEQYLMLIKVEFC